MSTSYAYAAAKQPERLLSHKSHAQEPIYMCGCAE